MIKTLRFLAVAEGISFLAIGITMVLKYGFQMPEPNFWVGLAHGILFIAYILVVLVCAIDQKWSFKKTFILGIASLIPFGTFWAEKKYLR